MGACSQLVTSTQMKSQRWMYIYTWQPPHTAKVRDVHLQLATSTQMKRQRWVYIYNWRKSDTVWPIIILLQVDAYCLYVFFTIEMHQPLLASALWAPVPASPCPCPAPALLMNRQNTHTSTCRPGGSQNEQVFFFVMLGSKSVYS